MNDECIVCGTPLYGPTQILVDNIELIFVCSKDCEYKYYTSKRGY